MVNSVLSSLLIFYMCAILVLVTVIEQIDKYRRHLFWRGADINAKKPSQAAWEMVPRPKTEGGLGIVNLRVKNEALL